MPVRVVFIWRYIDHSVIHADDILVSQLIFKILFNFLIWGGEKLWRTAWIRVFKKKERVIHYYSPPISYNLWYFCLISKLHRKTRTPSWPKKDFAIDVNFYKGSNKKVFCINLEQIGRKLKNSILIWWDKISFIYLLVTGFWIELGDLQMFLDCRIYKFS